MIRILIIEDERPAAKQLEKLLFQVEPDLTILDTIDSVEAGIHWLNTFKSPDLILSDIQLADGLSFEIFQTVMPHSPVIFTTAFDQYAIQAFKVNSLDYLLKPIEVEALEAALHKFKRQRANTQTFNANILSEMMQSMAQKKYKERFLVKTRQGLITVPANAAAYFYAEDGLVFLQHQNGKKHLVEYTLDQLEQLLNPSEFFRINRKFLIEVNAIKDISSYFNSRLKLKLTPAFKDEVIVSRERVASFKDWLDR